MKHHYVPQFLLRRWTNAVGRLHVFKVRAGRVVCDEHSPEYTGYEKGLYAVPAGAVGLSDDIIEKKLFGPIDDHASRVLEKLERHESISSDEHLEWTFFPCLSA